MGPAVAVEAVSYTHLPVDKHPALLAAVKELAIKKHGLLTDADFQGLVKTVA